MGAFLCRNSTDSGAIGVVDDEGVSRLEEIIVCLGMKPAADTRPFESISGLLLKKWTVSELLYLQLHHKRWVFWTFSGEKKTRPEINPT